MHTKLRVAGGLSSKGIIAWLLRGREGETLGRERDEISEDEAFRVKFSDGRAEEGIYLFAAVYSALLFHFLFSSFFRALRATKNFTSTRVVRKIVALHFSVGARKGLAMGQPEKVFIPSLPFILLCAFCFFVSSGRRKILCRPRCSLSVLHFSVVAQKGLTMEQLQEIFIISLPFILLFLGFSFFVL